MGNEDTRIPIKNGTHVEVELISRSGKSERLAFTLVEDEQADFAAGFLGEGTPLARTLIGHTAGELLPYAAGDLRSVRVMVVTVSERTQGENVAARRKAVLRQAVDHSDYINAMIFASSVNNKWGDYDVEGLDPDQWTDKPDQPDDPD
ncbi:MAG: hypothetical protein ABSB41_17860 [Anaerolineales bacterium]|jgi:hypothetical protein